MAFSDRELIAGRTEEAEIVIGLVEVDDATETLLPPPAALSEVTLPDDGHYKVRLVWDVPDETDSTNPLQFGYNIYRSPDYVDMEDEADFATALANSILTQLNSRPVIIEMAKLGLSPENSCRGQGGLNEFIQYRRCALCCREASLKYFYYSE